MALTARGAVGIVVPQCGIFVNLAGASKENG